ncbi:MAG: chromate efflux transporter [Alphaproteobacteria bacterium]|nr:chromate efflux transporter [Alphaproteobacteria bacterium]
MPDASAPAYPDRPTFAAALAYWFKLGCLSFGGPAGQIAMMQHDLVDGRRWIGQRAFLRGLSFATLLPGPEAQQLATYIGWRLHGTWGGVASGSLFVLPGALCMLALSWLAAAHGDTGVVGAIFDGLKPVVIAIVVHAVWRIGRKALVGLPAGILAAAAFMAIRFFGIDFPWVVAAAAVIGWLSTWGGRPSAFATGGHGDSNADEEPPHEIHLPANAWWRFARLAVTFGLLWAAPVALVLATVGTRPFADVAELFTKAAFVTFGGAYAVLPYVADAAVNLYGWLSPAEMLNGLALAESTPGPLILVLQYVGFFAGWNSAAADPLWPAVVSALLASYVTFLPSVAFILTAAPYIEGLHENRAASAALGAITAAVVGVVLNLAVFLGTAVFLPTPGHVDVPALAICAGALILLVRFRMAIHWLVVAGAAVGLVRLAVGL